MDAIVTLVNVLAILAEPNFGIHVDTEDTRPCLNERPVKEISVVGSNNVRSSLLYMCKEALNDTSLIRLVEDHEWTIIFWLGSVLEVIDIFRHDFAIRDQETLTVDHVRYHHDLVDDCVRKLQW